MTLNLILLGVALFGILLMILIRTYEIQKGRALVSKKVRFFADDFFTSVTLALLKIVVRMGNWISREFRLIPKRIKTSLAFIWHKIRNKVDSYFSHFHHHDNNKGSVSIYWKSIADHKNYSSRQSDK